MSRALNTNTRLNSFSICGRQTLWDEHTGDKVYYKNTDWSRETWFFTIRNSDETETLSLQINDNDVYTIPPLESFGALFYPQEIVKVSVVTDGSYQLLLQE